MNRLSKFLRLPLRRKVLVLRCWWSLNTVALALHFISLPRLLAILGTNGTGGSFVKTADSSKDEIVWSIRAAAALAWRPTCAVRGLVAERLLRRSGYAAQFKCGVARDEDFQAHAWVEDDSGILVGESERTYHSLPDFSSRNVSARP